MPGAMQIAGNNCCRSSICLAYRGPWTPATRQFHTSKTRQTESSQDASTLTDEAYSQVQIDPESKTVSTAAGALPISPLMDPEFHEARAKFTRAKPRSSDHKPTKFQRLLARNPYAQALATPVRYCPISSATLPNFFLQRFNLRTHPDTQTPWFIPQGLDKKTPNGTTAAEHKQDSETADTAQVSRQRMQTGPSTYVLSSQKLLQEMENKGSPYYGGQRKLMRQNGARVAPAVNAATWRADMNVVLLELMRRRIVESLLHFANMVEKEDRKYIVKCEHWDGIKELKHRGCLLFLGSEAEAEYTPPRLSTMTIEGVRFGGKLAVHDLRVLLGEEHVSRLRKESELLRDGSLFLLGRQATVKLQMLIWKLQGYMVWEEQGSTSSTSNPEQ